ncbi:4Fe-4S binding protein [Candidatus Contendibacter odensensis]|uniref:4Fe-4S ferredoxin iron-sulfur binding domain-containing protein n=1 Tax=Candidatus Contendobacter odensis Run_B_J11 TaxID=1400861 RepID=A0A7U7GAU7_9GAMM|nr:4Fe-4S binding protein [Candidatus Contendobacter odensis]CDH44946.1 putative 4Fe-4S ferredoxin iron-sulfur binding domain-containing protein [Candidatus Contendobacter odensis Run_B_J11]
MKQIKLKRIRVIVALTFLVLTTLLFMDFAQIGEAPGANVVLYPQFVPSLLKFSQTLAWAGTGFLAVLALTLLFGRVYCSALCPLGVLQDIVIRIADKLRKPRKIKFKYQKPHDALRYAVLALTVGLFLSGSILAVVLLDPFSNFGRIVGDLLRPLYIFAHNGVGSLLEAVGLRGPFPLHWKAPLLTTLVFPVLFLIGLVWLSAAKGRLFCNTLCPVGTLLGLVSRFAVFKIRIPKDACILCAQCSIHCKAGCIHLKTKEVDFSRCVACFDCIAVCEAQGIGYARSTPVLSHPSPSLIPTSHKERRVSRRALLRVGATALVGLAGLSRSGSGEATPYNRIPTVQANRKTWPVAPPGAGNLARFNDLCIACHLCVSACPYGVLQPALLEYGLSGLLQPRLDFAAGYCSYECNRCGQICPTGAIRPLDLTVKQTVQLGVAHFIRINCMVHTDHIACGVCEEACPTQAVHRVPYHDGLSIPEVREALCIGCGACENACPTRPYRAIDVDGRPIQQRAARPLSKPLVDMGMGTTQFAAGRGRGPVAGMSPHGPEFTGRNR